MTQVPAVVPFAGIGRGDTAMVGGKAASLGELTRAGVSVPPGFVVTTAAFRAALEGLWAGGGPEARVAALRGAGDEAVAATCTRLRAEVARAPLPAAVERAVREAYARLAGPGGDLPVAVRSSATSEDGEDASFAGLQDTHLWVRGAQEVLRGIRNCWSSLYSFESVTYRLRRDLPEEGLAMGVAVQQMVDARSSGVMFTRSPLTGDRSVVFVEASWGLGSAVVSGEVTPDAWVVNKVTGEVVRRTVSTKLRRHRPDPQGQGVIEEDVPERLQATPALSDQELHHLVEVGRGIERHYGAAQDIEWAIGAAAGGDGPPRLLVLQSRPETVWSGRQAPPAAAPAARAFDHVVTLLSGGVTAPGAQAPAGPTPGADAGAAPGNDPGAGASR